MIDNELIPILEQVARQHNVPVRVVKSVFLIYMRFIRVGLSTLEIENILTAEEMDQLRATFILPTIGKFYPDSKKTYAIYHNNKHIKNDRDKQVLDKDDEEDDFEESDSNLY